MLGLAVFQRVTPSHALAEKMTSGADEAKQLLSNTLCYLRLSP